MPYLSFKRFNPVRARSLGIKIKLLKLKLIFTWFCQKMISFPYYTRHLDIQFSNFAFGRFNLPLTSAIPIVENLQNRPKQSSIGRSLTVKSQVLTRHVQKHHPGFTDCLRRGNLMPIYCDILKEKLDIIIRVYVHDFTVLDKQTRPAAKTYF